MIRTSPQQVLAVNADNATANDTQTSELASMDNSFEEENRVRCFNHTLQLSAKTLLKPFNAGLSPSKDDDDLPVDEDGGGVVDLEDFGEDFEDSDGSDGDELSSVDDAEEDVDELEGLDADEQTAHLESTVGVRETVSKVFLHVTCLSMLTLFQIRKLSFSIIRSTTIALPAWRDACKNLGIKPKLIPRDVVTRWNSTYDMLCMALRYRKPIDAVTADKALKLRKYELDDEEWKVVEDLVDILEVQFLVSCL